MMDKKHLSSEQRAHIRPLTTEEWNQFVAMLDRPLTAEDIQMLDREFQRKLHASGQFEPRAKV